MSGPEGARLLFLAALGLDAAAVLAFFAFLGAKRAARRRRGRS